MPEQRNESSAALTCTYCGLLDWTVRKYGRVTHKQACPHRTDPWHQGDPKATAAQDRPTFAVRISRGLVTHWNHEPLLTWEQADECRRKIEELQHERGEVEEVLLSVEA